MHGMADPSPPPAADQGLRCLECDYNLTGIDSARCPECGAVLDWSQLRRLARDRLAGVPPWETRREAGPLAGFLRTARLATLNAGWFSARIPPSASRSAARRYTLVCWAVGCLCASAFVFLLPDVWRMPTHFRYDLLMGAVFAGWITLVVMLTVSHVVAWWICPAVLLSAEFGAWVAIVSYQGVWFVLILPGVVLATWAGNLPLVCIGLALSTAGTAGWWFSLARAMQARRAYGTSVGLLHVLTVPAVGFFAAIIGFVVGTAPFMVFSWALEAARM